MAAPSEKNDAHIVDVAGEPVHLASIANFLWYDPAIGVESAQITGFPGSGKSNLGNSLLNYCLENGECGLLRGDLFAEWRHWLLQDWAITLVLPDPLEVHCIGFELETVQQNTNLELEYYAAEDRIKIMDYIKPKTITVVFDAGYQLASRGWLWADIFKQLVKRKTLIETPVTYLDMEAGVLLPEMALSSSKEAESHWKACNRTIENFVFFRKGLIRGILISQLEGEITYRIRDKCLFKIHKQGIAGKRYPQQIIKECPRQRVDQYIMSVGREVYTRWNESEKFPEISNVWKMIVYDEDELSYPYPLGKEPQKHTLHAVCLDCGEDWEPIKEDTKRCQYCQRNPGNVKILKIPTTTKKTGV